MIYYIIFIDSIICILLFNCLCTQYKSYQKYQNGHKNARKAILIFLAFSFINAVNKEYVDLMVYGIREMDTDLFFGLSHFTRINLLVLALVFTLIKNENNFEFLSRDFYKNILKNKKKIYMKNLKNLFLLLAGSAILAGCSAQNVNYEYRTQLCFKTNGYASYSNPLTGKIDSSKYGDADKIPFDFCIPVTLLLDSGKFKVNFKE